MDTNAMLQRVQDILQRSSLEDLRGADGSLSQTTMIALIVVAVFGLVWAFFGLKLIRLWSALFGLIVGFFLGGAGAMAFGVNDTISLVIGIALGIILACLGAGIYRVGIFLIAWIVGFACSASFIEPQDWIPALLCAGIGLLIALITLAFAEPVTMVITGLFGAIIAGECIAALLDVSSTTLQAVIMVAIAVLGIVVQFLLESRRRKKQNLKKAAEIREKESTENEIERARAMAETLDAPVSSDDDDEYGAESAEEQPSRARKQQKKQAEEQPKRHTRRRAAKNDIVTLDEEEFEDFDDELDDDDIDIVDLDDEKEE